MLRRLSPGFALVVGMVLAIAIAGTSTAANGPYRTFGDGDITFTGGTVHLDNGAGEYSGIYHRGNPLSGRRLANVHVSFISSGATEGGAPRFSIPLNTGHAESTTPFAFLDVNNCGSNWVSTDNPHCKVFLNFSSESFSNWDDLAATHPTWRIPRHGIPFIIADVPGHYVVSHIDLT
jgi:hypothetical protein